MEIEVAASGKHGNHYSVVGTTTLHTNPELSACAIYLRLPSVLLPTLCRASTAASQFECRPHSGNAALRSFSSAFVDDLFQLRREFRIHRAKLEQVFDSESPRCTTAAVLPGKPSGPSPSRTAPRRTKTNRCVHPAPRPRACSGDMYATVPTAAPGLVSNVPPSHRRHRRDTSPRATRSQLCQTKIKNLGVSPLRHEDVRWLDVAVNDSFGVRGFERVGNFNPTVPAAARSAAPCRNAVLQGLPRPETPSR